MNHVTICPDCGKPLPEIPDCYAAEAPWRSVGVPEVDFAARVDLTDDQCVVDEKYFFLRGHIEIPIIGSPDLFSWSVWCSLSEKSFLHASQRWFEDDRADDPPYFGWLMTSIPAYPETLHLKTSVQSREVGRVPLVTLEPSDHPLAIDQQQGITRERIAEIAHVVLHDRG